MNEADTGKSISGGEDRAQTARLALGDFKINTVSSGENVKNRGEVLNAESENALDRVGQRSAEIEADAEISARVENPIFKRLAEPTLPELGRSDRARLQMQSPTRLHFYWSFETDPFETARRVLGASANDYTLVVRLFNETNGREQIVAVEREGSWWFDADADCSYRAETGFYRAHRPFVRLTFSNRIETPRKNPSQHRAETAAWTISADAFAEVLDNSGFSHDAFEVALAGDDSARAETATQTAFAQMFGETNDDASSDNSSEMRVALLALAAGYAPETLRGQISHSLFLRLEKNADRFSREKALVALRKNFGAFAVGETAETEALPPTIFGASLVNFPRRASRRFVPKFTNFSSSNAAAKN